METIFKIKRFYSKGKVCGVLKDGTYFKEVDSRKHKMRIYDGYGISDEIVNAIYPECNRIRLREKDTKRIYEVSMEDFMSKAFVKNWDGLQYFLPIKFWRLEDSSLKLF